MSVGELFIVTALGAASPSGAKVTPVEPRLARVTLPLMVSGAAKVRPPPSSCNVPPLRTRVPTPKGLYASAPPETVLLAPTGSSRAAFRSRLPLKLVPVMPSDSVPPL